MLCIASKIPPEARSLSIGAIVFEVFLYNFLAIQRKIEDINAIEPIKGLFLKGDNEKIEENPLFWTAIYEFLLNFIGFSIILLEIRGFWQELITSIS